MQFSTDSRTHFRLGVEDQTFVQSISYSLDQLLPDAVLQKLLGIHLKINSVFSKSLIGSFSNFFLELHCD